MLDEWRGIGLRTIDWNCNGSLDPGTVAQDLDGNSWCGKNGAKTLLRDYDDWTNIRDTAIAGSDGPFETITCMTACRSRSRRR